MIKNPETDGRTPLAQQLVVKGKEIIRTILYGDQSYNDEDPILPDSVRYALAYNRAQLGAREALDLVDTGGFSDLATYCILKATTRRKDLQSLFLEEFVNLVKTDSSDRRTLAILQRETVKKLGQDFIPIQGTKLGQISRQGLSLWDQRFREVAQDLKGRSPETVGVYVSYSATLGLRQAVDVLGKNRLMMLILEWISQLDNPDCGYEIDLDSPYDKRVRLLPKDFERPESFVIIDDTLRTGIHSQSIWNFWSQNSGDSMPPGKVFIIDHVPKNQYI